MWRDTHERKLVVSRVLVRVVEPAGAGVVQVQQQPVSSCKSGMQAATAAHPLAAGEFPRTGTSRT